MLTAARMQERSAEFAHRRQFVAEQHLAVQRVDRLAPRRVGLPFLEDGNPFAEPARHFVVRLVERHDMTELVPQRCLPASRMRRLRGRAVGRDDRAEADAEEPRTAGQAERADREIFLFGKHLNNDRRGERDVVLRTQVAFRSLEQIEYSVAVDVRLASVHAESDTVRFKRAKLRDALLQRDQIVREDVVAVRLVDLVGQLPTFLFLAQPQQV